MRILQLVPGGRWYVGTKLPFFVPESMVTAAVEDLGFTGVEWYDRDDAMPPVDPRGDPQYSDGWSEWATGVYQGAPRSYSLTYNVPWVVSDAPAEKPVEALPGHELTLDQKVTGLFNKAVKSDDSRVRRVVAQMIRAQGFTRLADELERPRPAAASPLSEKSTSEPGANPGGVGVFFGLPAVGLWFMRKVRARRS
jgi:hypothetical protein